VEVVQGDWLEKMMAYAQQPTIGAVGVKLLFPGGNIQHAGIVLGVGEASAHAFINLPNDSPAHFNYIHATNNFSAVTAACLMVHKEVYDKVGGMDENLPVEFNDIDFCLKLGKAGYYNVYLPTVTLYHYESATRGHPFKSIASWKQHEKDLGYFKQKWGSLVNRDPFYNINLSSEYTDFRQKKRNKA
jgi:GT2 family glycosyltransferase